MRLKDALYQIRLALVTVPEGTYIVSLKAVNPESTKAGKRLLNFVFETHKEESAHGTEGITITKTVSANMDRRGELRRLISDLDEQQIPLPKCQSTVEGLTTWIQKFIGRKYRAAVTLVNNRNAILSIGTYQDREHLPF